MAQSTLNTFLLPDFISALQPKMEAYQQFGPRPDPVEGLWPGYTCVGKDERNGERVFVLMPQDDCRPPVDTCPCCGCQLCTEDGPVLENVKRNGYTMITLRDGFAMELVWLRVHQPKWACKRCRKHLCGVVPFKHPNHNITMSVFDFIRCSVVGEFYKDWSSLARAAGVDRSIVERIAKITYMQEFVVPSLEGVTRIGLDEHSIRRGQRYCLVLYDLSTLRLLYISEGRRKEDLQPFFDRLKAEGRLEQIQYVSCDCSAGYIAMVEENMPKAHVVIDEFHALNKLSDGLEKVRVAVRASVRVKQRLATCLLLDPPEAQGPKARALKKTLKADYGYTAQSVDEFVVDVRKRGSVVLDELARDLDDLKWARHDLILGKAELVATMAREETSNMRQRSRDKLKRDREFASRLLAIYKRFPRLNDAAQLADEFRKLWHGGLSPDDAIKHVTTVIELAKALPESQELTSFMNYIEKHKYHVNHACSAGISNSVVEGCNSRAKAYQRQIRGVKDIAIYMLVMHHIFKHPRKVKHKPTYVADRVAA